MLSDCPRVQSDLPSTVADSPFIYDDLVSADNLLRRIRDDIDFSFARDLVVGFYCLDNGRPGIAPETLCRITFLQYLYNLSDREVIDACQNRLDFKFFLGLGVESHAPCDASTLSRARARWGESTFKSFFERTVEIARAKKILGAKRVVDSSKTLMNAAVLRSSELLRRLCAKLLSALKSLDLPQDETLSRLEAQATALIEDTSWLLSDELKEKRYVRWGEHADELLSYVLALLARIDAEAADDSAVRELKVNYVRKLSKLLAKHLGDEALEKQLKVKTEAKKNGGSKKTAKSRPTGKKDKLVSDVDSEARHAADHKRKVKAGYKTHVTMDCDSEIVTAVIVTPMNCDDGPVLPALIADELRRGLKIEEVAADAAYADGPVREALAKEKISTYIPDPAPKPSAQGKYISKDFRFDPAAMTLTCPGNRVSSTATPKGDSYLFYFSREGCAACPLKAACLSQREIASGVKHGRTVSVTRFRPLHEAARAAHESAGHKDAMNRRLAVEHKQAEMLNQRGLRNARYRGLMKTSTQGYLTAFATNIRRMAVLALSAEKVGETAAKPA